MTRAPARAAGITIAARYLDAWAAISAEAAESGRDDRPCRDTSPIQLSRARFSPVNQPGRPRPLKSFGRLVGKLEKSATAVRQFRDGGNACRGRTFAVGRFWESRRSGGKCGVEEAFVGGSAPVRE